MWLLCEIEVFTVLMLRIQVVWLLCRVAVLLISDVLKTHTLFIFMQDIATAHRANLSLVHCKGYIING
jgi:hypothetical protein